uniref:C2 domain-containing protein n=1 Tax=Chenopodium quinoa TaxID=63459 RepID=A0A803LFX5_CHEQI
MTMFTMNCGGGIIVIPYSLISIWNKLTGSIQASFGSFNTNVSLLLYDNQLSGPIPKSLGQAKLSKLRSSNNQLSGYASFLFGIDKPELTDVSLRNNKFKFDFSNVDLFQGLRNLDIAHNIHKAQLGERWPHGGVRGGHGWIGGDRTSSTYDLVEQMNYLYVHVVRAKDLPVNPVTGSCDPYVEVKLGNYKGKTKHFENKINPEWKQVFAFSKEKIQSTVLEVYVRDREMVGRDEYLGKVVFDLNEVPTRVPPDSPLAPQWYRLEDRRGEVKTRGEVMVAVWMGTQADEAFPEAWHTEAASVVSGEGVYNIRSKVYVSPKLWYLRVNVIEAQDVEPHDKSQLPQVFIKAQLGNQILKTKVCPVKTTNPLWNEDLIFVAAEPFEEMLVLELVNKASSKDELVGKISLPLNVFEKRLDHKAVHSRWFNLERFGFGALEGDKRNELKFSTRVHLRVCLEGGYHVLDESTMYISDTRPTARQLWKQPMGILEVGILSAQGLSPMKKKEGSSSTDAYCVAKYGLKWVRTRTIIQSFNPKWNEQYLWEVYDPCTVITLAVFDNCHLGGDDKSAKDPKIGKIRIRLSTLETDRIYTHSYPLLVLQSSDALCPPFHHKPIGQLKIPSHEHCGSEVRQSRTALRREVVEYMLDVDSHIWSMRKSKANFFRIVSVFSGMLSMSKWLGEVCKWKNPVTTVLVHILYFILICYPELILPTVCLYMFLIGIWNYRYRPRHPPHMDTKLSWADAAHPDET